MSRRKESYNRNAKTYVYKGMLVDAVNKPEAAEIFGIKDEREYKHIKRIKTPEHE